MSNPYRDMIAQLAAALQQQVFCDPEIDGNDLPRQARELLDQPKPKGAKPVVDYSRVPEIATEAQIRSAAQYLVKKRNCDGDLIPAIEYAIARWGCSNSQPEPPEPSEYDEPARFAAWLREHSSDCMELGRPDWAHMSSRAAELLEHRHTPPNTP